MGLSVIDEGLYMNFRTTKRLRNNVTSSFDVHSRLLPLAKISIYGTTCFALTVMKVTYTFLLSHILFSVLNFF